MTPILPRCSLCHEPLVCHPNQPAHEIAWRICATCSAALAQWAVLARVVPANPQEVRH